ncbi:MAG: glucosaminidase domain-containing protein [Sphingobacteriaceae bacterium]|nr:glucosaminidase domain-containing protein [Sphingobacteriaceae bacterium]
MKHTSLFLLAFFITFAGFSQNGSSLKQAYVEKYKLMAIENMHRTGVPASITLAQGLLESGVGQSPLAIEANNHFGIKCHKEWTGPTFTMDDDEKDECFRKYPSALDSYLDHAAFLKSRPRYAELFKLEITDYKGWAHGLKAAGYATNPNYAPLLIKQIEELGLADYDRVNPTQLAALQGKKKDEKPVEAVETPSAQASIAQIPCQEGVFKYNKVKVVCAKAGDSPLSIAETYGLYPYQILKFNDLAEEVRFREGELVYIEAKRKRAEVAQHVVGEYESVRDLSQRYGISTSAIRRKNQLRAAEEFAAGETAYFVQKRADKPKVRSLAEIETLRSERDRKEAAMKKPATPPVVKSKSAPAYAAPVEKATPKPNAAVAEMGNSLEIKQPEVKEAAPKPTKAAEPTTKPTPEPTKPAVTSTPASSKGDSVGEKVSSDTQPTKVDAPKAPASKEVKKHTVVKGDTLFNISRRYGLTVAELKELNKMQTNDISLGMELIVSK